MTSLDIALMNAVHDKNAKEVEHLLRRGANPNTVIDSATPLLLAAGYKQIEICRLLIRHGADPNLSPTKDATPLLTAASFGFCDIVKLLVGAGGDPNFRDAEGLNCHYWAEKSKCKTCCSFFMDLRKSTVDVFKKVHFSESLGSLTESSVSSKVSNASEDQSSLQKLQPKSTNHSERRSPNPANYSSPKLNLSPRNIEKLKALLMIGSTPTNGHSPTTTTSAQDKLRIGSLASLVRSPQGHGNNSPANREDPAASLSSSAPNKFSRLILHEGNASTSKFLPLVNKTGTAAGYSIEKDKKNLAGLPPKSPRMPQPSTHHSPKPSSSSPTSCLFESKQTHSNHRVLSDLENKKSSNKIVSSISPMKIYSPSTTIFPSLLPSSTNSEPSNLDLEGLPVLDFQLARELNQLSMSGNGKKDSAKSPIQDAHLSSPRKAAKSHSKHDVTQLKSANHVSSLKNTPTSSATSTTAKSYFYEPQTDKHYFPLLSFECSSKEKAKKARSSKVEKVVYADEGFSLSEFSSSFGSDHDDDDDDPALESSHKGSKKDSSSSPTFVVDNDREVSNVMDTGFRMSSTLSDSKSTCYDNDDIGGGGDVKTLDQAFCNSSDSASVGQKDSKSTISSTFLDDGISRKDLNRGFCDENFSNFHQATEEFKNCFNPFKQKTKLRSPSPVSKKRYLNHLPGKPIHLPGKPIQLPGKPNHQPENPIHGPGDPIHQPGHPIHQPGDPIHRPGDPLTDWSFDEILSQVECMKDDELRSKLQSFKVTVGPILKSTKKVYQTKLAKLMVMKKTCTDTKEIVIEPSLEVIQICSDALDRSLLDELEVIMSQPFSDPKPSANWRQGTKKSCFNYLLLDPRVTKNLPKRVKAIGQKKGFLIFVESVFYIGKGQKLRPYEHLREAATQMSKVLSKGHNKKVAKILEIWKAGMGVISLCAFQNAIPVESLTREACMIDAIGLNNLANVCRGQLYGPASNWSKKDIRRLGSWLLWKCFMILLNEGERQIKYKDINETNNI